MSKAFRLMKMEEAFQRSQAQRYDAALEEFAPQLCELMIKFMDKARPLHYDGPEVIPHDNDARGILDDWLIELTVDK